MLTIEIRNTGTGTDENANYDYSVFVNGSKIASGTVIGHNRADGWPALVKRIAEPRSGIIPLSGTDVTQ